MENKTKVALLVNKKMAESIFEPAALEFLATFAEFNPANELPDEMTLDFMAAKLADAECAVTCWGTPPLTDGLAAAAPKLRLLAHAAGSVKNLVPPEMWRARRCRVTSNAPVIAEAVAQTTLSFILCSLGQFWALSAAAREGKWSGGESSLFTTKAINGLTVGIVGASLAGREVINILKPFNCNILLYDPYTTRYDAALLGVTLTEFETLLRSSDVVSLHVPGNLECKAMLNAANLPLLKDGALLVNTSRGIVIDETALAKELESGRIFACIDVTDPEPPAKDHPFRRLPNVILTPHIAGGHTVNGRRKLGNNTVNEIYNYIHKGVIKYEVREEMLTRMA